MNRVLAIAIGASLLLAPVAQRAANASVMGPAYPPVAHVSVNLFYGELSPWGHWVNMPAYGWCWVPDDVYAGWRPYTDGAWVYTDVGWTWASDEPWSWAVYHYGRWDWDPTYGWVWVPGTEWGPAWVVWRTDYDWVGWAPMPPSVGWTAWFGMRSSDVVDVRAQAWSFTHARELGSPNLRDRIEPRARNASLVRLTRDATRFERKDGRPFLRGVDVAQIEKRSGARVPRYTIRDDSSPHGTGGSGRGGLIAFYRPDVRRAAPGEAPPASAQRRDPGRSFAAERGALPPVARPEWRGASPQPGAERGREASGPERGRKPVSKRPPDPRDRPDEQNQQNEKHHHRGPGDQR